MIRRRLKFVPGTLRALAVLSGLILLLSGCGGGPIVATSTGRILYVATTSGIYGFAIMSDGTLNPVSSQPLDPGSYSQIAATSEPPTGQTSPLLLGASGLSSLTVWTIGGTGPLTKTTSLVTSVCPSNTYSGPITGVAVTSDNKYAFVVNGTAPAGASTYNTATLALSGGGCTASAMTTTTGTVFPVQPSLDCQEPLSPSTCTLFLTLSTTATTTPISATTPEEDTFTETSGVLGTPTYTPYSSCAFPNCPSGVTFNANTLYFYTSFNGSSPSLQSIGPESTASTSTVNFSSASLNLPCMDSIGGNAYIPTSNGYLYSVGVGSGGSLGSVTTLVTPSTFGTPLYMNSCAVATNP